MADPDLCLKLDLQRPQQHSGLNHGRNQQSVRLQHRAHPLPAARTQAAGRGVLTGRISVRAPRRVQSGLWESPSSCSGPDAGAGARLPAVPRDGLWRGVLPVRIRLPSQQHLSKLWSLRALQQQRSGLRRYDQNLSCTL